METMKNKRYTQQKYDAYRTLCVFLASFGCKLLILLYINVHTRFTLVCLLAYRMFFAINMPIRSTILVWLGSFCLLVNDDSKYKVVSV